MCGLLFSLTGTDRCLLSSPFYLTPNQCDCVGLHSNLVRAITRRGPDHQSSFSHSTNEYSIDLYASVLHIRGTQIASQPVTSDCGNYVLAWNGESYSDDVSRGESDTSHFFALLRSNSWDPLRALASWDGPLCFRPHRHSQ